MTHKNVLLEAVEEMKMLRRRNEVLEAQLAVMNLFAVALHHQGPTQSQAARVDPLWNLEQALQAEIVAEKLQGQNMPEAGNAQVGSFNAQLKTAQDQQQKQRDPQKVP